MKVSWKGGALLGPLPAVMVSCGTKEKANILTVAWTGITCTNPPKCYISLRPSRHSYDIIKESGEFVINLTPERLCETADYVGIVTGRCVDKVGKCNFTMEDSEHVKAPRIAQCPVCLECKVTDIIPLGTHDMFLCDIVSVAVDEELIDENGKLDLDSAHLVGFAHGAYYSLSRKIGSFGYSMAEKKKGKGAVIKDGKSCTGYIEARNSFFENKKKENLKAVENTTVNENNRKPKSDNRPKHKPNKNTSK